MSSLLDMISAFIAFLLTAAFLHFGAADDSNVRGVTAPVPAAAQSRSESTMSPDTTAAPQDARPIAAPATAEPPADRNRT